MKKYSLLNCQAIPKAFIPRSRTHSKTEVNDTNHSLKEPQIQYLKQFIKQSRMQRTRYPLSINHQHQLAQSYDFSTSEKSMINPVDKTQQLKMNKTRRLFEKQNLNTFNFISTDKSIRNTKKEVEFEPKIRKTSCAFNSRNRYRLRQFSVNRQGVNRNRVNKEISTESSQHQLDPWNHQCVARLRDPESLDHFVEYCKIE